MMALPASATLAPKHMPALRTPTLVARTHRRQQQQQQLQHQQQQQQRRPSLLARAGSADAAVMALPSEQGAAAASPAAVASEVTLLMQRWRRRLLTRRDFMRSHAASSALFLLGGTALELVTNAQWAAGFRQELWYPQHGYELLAMQAVIAVSAATGLVLTAESRKGAERAFFASFGVQALQSCALTLWASPFYPEALRGCHALDVVMGATSVVSALAGLPELWQSKDEAMALRNRGHPAAGGAAAAAAAAAGPSSSGDAASTSSGEAASTSGGDAASATSGRFIDWLSEQPAYQDFMYFLPTLPGVAFTVAGGLLQANDGRAWLDAFSAAHPEYFAVTLHTVTATTLAGHAAMFAVTLRDKKLISQASELGIAGATNVASLAYMGCLFAQYPWMAGALGVHMPPL